MFCETITNLISVLYLAVLAISRTLVTGRTLVIRVIAISRTLASGRTLVIRVER